tara:strand:- start:29347 stop:29970 length:624 start_codon:yes stop_codon:yes gene_type:complete
MLKITGLEKSFDHRKILNGVNLAINKGETIGLIGINGVGKTTLLRIMAGITSFENGNIQKNKKKMLYLGHQPNLYSVLTAEENLKLLMKLYGNSVDGDKLSSAMNKVGLKTFGKLSIRNFSRGMLQRLQIAKALLIDWELLLMDEPAEGLDESGLQLLETMIVKWQGENRSMLMVSHNREWLRKYCNKLTLLENGKLSETELNQGDD